MVMVMQSPSCSSRHSDPPLRAYAAPWGTLPWAYPGMRVEHPPVRAQRIFGLSPQIRSLDIWQTSLDVVVTWVDSSTDIIPMRRGAMFPGW